jgi:2,5-diamino-6-(ribosylamino)-4(3H)-pyrimidinone 5'-phosphate reductase
MKRPHVVINCAMSADGKIASPTRKQMRISSDEDMKRTHQLRNKCDAVLVGIGTILADDPRLTVKKIYIKNPKQPLRVILDSKGRTPAHALALNTMSKTLIITAEGKEKTYTGSHIEVVSCKIDKNGLIDVKSVLDLLYRKGVRTLLVEGGGTIIWNFLKNRVVDDLYLFIGSCIIGGKETPTVADGEGIKSEEDNIPLKIVRVKRVGLGLLIHYQSL